MANKPKVLSTVDGGTGTANTGTSAKILIGNGSAFIESTPTFPTTAGSSGNILTSNGTNWTSAAPASAGAYVLNMINSFDTGSADPADGATYYMSNSAFTTFTVATNAHTRMYIPRSGTITKCYGAVTVQGTLGSTQSSTVSIRLNNSSDTTVTSSLQLSSSNNLFNNTSLNITVSAGDYVQFKFACPTWSPNPTTCAFSGAILVV